MKIVVAGGSGFIGSHVVAAFREKGHTVELLTRNPEGEGHLWNPEKWEINPEVLEGVDVVINLCGESVSGRWTQGKMERIRKSRFQATALLSETLYHLENPPKLYIGASAIGYYGDRGSERLTEWAASGHGYLAEVCREWERIPEKLTEKKIRTIAARFGVVLGRGGGAFERMLKPFKWGLGGKLGTGKQFMSWVAVEDVVGALDHIIHHPELSGPVNIVAPHPVRNETLTQELAKQLGKPAHFPVPQSLLYLLFRSGADIFLKSACVIPERLHQSGYTFQFPTISEALSHCLKTVADKSKD